MNNDEYMKMLMVFSRYLDSVVIQWINGLKVRCISDFGINESSTEPEDEDYIGEYYTIVRVLETLEFGADDSVPIFNNYIEISMNNIPEKISLEDGTILWSNEDNK